MQPTTVVSTYYGMHGMNNQGSVVYDFNVEPGRQGYYKVLIQWFEWRGGDGYRVQYSFNNSSFANINSNLFYYDVVTSTVTEQNEKAAKEQTRTTVETELGQLKQYRNDIMSAISTKAYDAMQAIKNKSIVDRFSYGMISNDGAYYIWPGDLGVPLRPNAVASTDAQHISEAIMDLNNNEVVSDPFVINLQQPPEYTVMMWIKVHKTTGYWRRIFLHGTGDDWTNHENDPNTVTTDRTPGVWIWPSQAIWGGVEDGKVRVHFRHRAKSCTSSSWRIYGGDRNCGLDLMDGTLPNFGEWFHFAATIKTVPTANASEVRVYLNGILHSHAQLADNNKFDWNALYGKKLHVGGWGEAGSGPLHIQKAKWYSVSKTAEEVLQEYQAGYVSGGPTPFPVPPNVPSNLTTLFRDATTEQTYFIKIGNATHSVYVEPPSASNGNQAWLLIMNYNRNAGDSKAITIRRNMDHAFPQGLGKQDVAWGQVPKEILNAINFNAVRMKATNQNGKVIHFITRHPNVISYIKTGTGQFPITQSNWYNLLGDHNSSIPQSATLAWGNQGDYALNYAPFYIGASKHWDAGLWNRWEVDDYPNDGRNATHHTVWIGL